MQSFIFKLALPSWVFSIILLILYEIGLPVIFVIAFALFGGWVLGRLSDD